MSLSRLPSELTVAFASPTPRYDERKKRFQTLMQQVKYLHEHIGTYIEQVRNLIGASQMIAEDMKSICRGAYVETVPESAAGEVAGQVKKGAKAVWEQLKESLDRNKDNADGAAAGSEQAPPPPPFQPDPLAPGVCAVADGCERVHANMAGVMVDMLEKHLDEVAMAPISRILQALATMRLQMKERKELRVQYDHYRYAPRPLHVHCYCLKTSTICDSQK